MDIVWTSRHLKRKKHLDIGHRVDIASFKRKVIVDIASFKEEGKHLDIVDIVWTSRHLRGRSLWTSCGHRVI